MSLADRHGVALALERVGELLAADGEEFSIVIIGGAAMNLLGLVARTTDDVDVIAVGSRDGAGELTERILPPPDPLPESVLVAIRTVAQDMNLDIDWMNTVSALQWKQELPPGMGARVSWKTYGSALHVGLASRTDLIFLKLYAAADSVGSSSVHYQDLRAMRPTAAELNSAEEWVRTQDAGATFPSVLRKVVSHLQADLNE